VLEKLKFSHHIPATARKIKQTVENIRYIKCSVEKTEEAVMLVSERLMHCSFFPRREGGEKRVASD
jgi:hypothetical protein